MGPWKTQPTFFYHVVKISYPNVLFKKRSFKFHLYPPPSLLPLRRRPPPPPPAFVGSLLPCRRRSVGGVGVEGFGFAAGWAAAFWSGNVRMGCGKNGGLVWDCLIFWVDKAFLKGSQSCMSGYLFFFFFGFPFFLDFREHCSCAYSSFFFLVSM